MSIRPITICCGALFTLTLASFSAHASQISRPNVVVIVADDLGLGDIGRYHQEYTQQSPLANTPTIDALAAQGISFTDAHSPAALCAPSRYSIMTGNATIRSPYPWGVWNTFQASAITAHDATLGRVAKQAGYATGFVGKWHIGGRFKMKDGSGFFTGKANEKEALSVDLTHWFGDNPETLGFEYNFTAPAGVQGPFYMAYENNKWAPFSKDSRIVYVDENNALDPLFVSDKGPGVGDSHWDGRKLNMILADKAVNFIEKNAGNKPFLLTYWSPAVHIPHIPMQEIDGRKIAGTTPTSHLDMNRVLDIEVEKIVNALKKAGQYDNTIIVFTSDNGGLIDLKAEKLGHDSAGPWRGNKNQPYEGGHRVPFILTWPKHLKEARTHDSMVNGTDIVATIASAVGTELKSGQALDSLNLLPLLTGAKFEARREMFIQAGNQKAIIYREGDWKLIIQSNTKYDSFNPIALFNLKDNPRELEKYNFIDNDKHQSRVANMLKRSQALIISAEPSV